MTTRQADRLIKTGEVATFRTYLGDVFRGVAISRERTTIAIQVGDHLGVFGRADLELVTLNPR
jgi:hypothetical protein